MKCKVLIAFADKHTGKKHKKGDIIDVPVNRFNEITDKGRYIQPVEETAPAKV